MRLNRKDKDKNTELSIPSEKKIEEEIPKPKEEPKPEPPKEEEDQPAFVPRRMNLRNRIGKKEEGYNPSSEKTVEEPKKEEPKKEEPKNEYVPNRISRKEEPKD